MWVDMDENTIAIPLYEMNTKVDKLDIVVIYSLWTSFGEFVLGVEFFLIVFR